MSNIKRFSSTKDRLLAYRAIDPVTNCWNWTRAKLKKGYGKTKVGGRNGRWMLVHRLSAVEFLNFDPDSRLLVLHRCDNPSCFNPEHLFIGSQQDNIHDCVDKGRSNKPHGIAHHHAKLVESQIKEMRILASQGQSYAEIGRLYRVTPSYARSIVKYERWKHLD